MNKVLHILIAVCCAGTAGKLPAMIALNNIFHHRADENTTALEMGKIAFYFAKDPIITRLPGTEKKGVKQEQIFLPKVTVTDAIHAMLTQFNTKQDMPYRVTVNAVNKPVPGLSISIAYDPQHIDIAYELFDSIKLDKGFVIRFYNKKLIEEMAKKDKKLLQFASGKKKGVVVDCGHGGVDIGAVGHQGVREKDITLDVGRAVAHLLAKEGYEVFLTRSNDATVPLDRRTTLANNWPHNHILVSIHANQAPNKQARGIETFCVQERLFKPWHSTLSSQANAIIQAHNVEQNKMSKLLAQSIQKQLVDGVKEIQPSVVDRSVKYAASQMLLGSNSPAILVEIGFVSHKDECALLSTVKYQHCIAQSICKGINEYFATSVMA